METITLNGFTARVTDKALAFTVSSENNQKPLWIPASKIQSYAESDALSVAQQYAGETISRVAIPCTIKVDAAWLKKINPALAG